MRTVTTAIPASLLVLALVIACGCESRQEIAQGEVVGIADNLQRANGVTWGAPVEVLPPVDADAGGHRWWQLRYADEVGGIHGSRLIIVDADTAWARVPPPGYLVRRPASASRPSAANPVTVQEGRFILQVTTPQAVSPEREAELVREATRLNALGGESGLFPLFSLRKDREGRSAVVYGWQGDRGIARDERIADWLRARTPYASASWIDLLE